VPCHQKHRQAWEADDIYVHNQDWIIGYEDDEQMVMYYTKPLAPEQTTTNFIVFYFHMLQSPSTVILFLKQTKSFHFHQTPGTHQALLRSHLLRYSPELP